MIDSRSRRGKEKGKREGVEKRKRLKYLSPLKRLRERQLGHWSCSRPPNLSPAISDVLLCPQLKKITDGNSKIMSDGCGGRGHGVRAKYKRKGMSTDMDVVCDVSLRAWMRKRLRIIMGKKVEDINKKKEKRRM
jgi:hypothetical protein